MSPAEQDRSSETENDTRRRFREALERKQAGGQSHVGPTAEAGAQLKASNAKRKRQFRRKSG
jgi:hypothetical protein